MKSQKIFFFHIPSSSSANIKLILQRGGGKKIANLRVRLRKKSGFYLLGGVPEKNYSDFFSKRFFWMLATQKLLHKSISSVCQTTFFDTDGRGRVNSCVKGAIF